MVAFNVVRARVRPEFEAEFLALNDNPGHEVARGLRCMSLVRTEEQHCYCFVGEWDSLDALAEAQPVLGQWLARMLPMLEETNESMAVAGKVVARLKPRVEAGDWRSC
jgi:hypothetical protein